MPMPFNGASFDFLQPDGTALRVRGWGCQYHAAFETLNGYAVTRNPGTGYFEYADIAADREELIPTGARPRFTDPRLLGLAPGIRIGREAAKARAREGHGLPPGNSRWEARRRQQQAVIRTTVAGSGVAAAPPGRPTVGDFVGLCLLIDFPDVPGTVAPEEIEGFCNRPGYAGYGNNGSVFDYFLENSGGRLRYTNIIAPYYTAKHNRAYYTDEKVAQPIRARELIKEALADLQARGFDFTRLTADDQDFVFATNVFYAGGRVNNWAKGLWPHSYHLLTPHRLAAGRHAFDYQITNIGNELSLGTFCHENGHMVCDFPDLYDYGYESAGIGTYCLMGSGASASPKNPPQVNAYLRYRAGWAQSVIRISGGIQASLPSAGARFYMHPNGRTEYFIMENRHRSGRDLALPGSGLAIWHVDELGDNQHEQRTRELHYECALVQADGRNDLENDPHNFGDTGDLFGQGVNERFGAGTEPNSRWWDGSSSGLEIRDIGAPGLTMTFRTEA